MTPGESPPPDRRITDERGRPGRGVSGDGDPGGPAPDGLDFPVTARLELDTLLRQLRDRADEVLGTQGRLRGLLRANAAVASDLSLPIVLHRVLEAARDLLSARYAAIGVNSHDGRLEQFVHSGMPTDLVARIGNLPQGGGILGVLISDPSPLRLADLSTHPATSGVPAGHPPMSSFLGVPIRVGDAVFGSLYVTERVDGAEFSADDEQLATALAVAAGGAIANARLFSESEQRRRWLTASGELTAQVLDPGAEKPLAAVAKHAAAAAMADFATVAISHGDDEVLVTAVGGILGVELEGVTTSLTDSLAGLAIRTGKSSLVADYHQMHPPVVSSIDIGPVLVVPISAGELTHGALVLGRVREHAEFTDADLDMAAAFAAEAAVVLELVVAREKELRLRLLDDHDRIAGDLHDHVIQELFALGMGLQGLATVTDNPAQVARIVGYVDTLDTVVSTLRTAIFGLQPARNDPAGLQTRILAIATEHTAQLGYAPHVRFAGLLDVRVTGPLAADVLAVIREAISNCARHARATRLDITAVLTPTLLTLDITDNGVGIDTSGRSSGLQNLRTRAERHRGTFVVTAPDHGGTHLRWAVQAPAA